MPYKGIEKCVDFFRGIQVKFDSDLIVANTGMRGSGKSTFGTQCSRIYTKKYLGREFQISDLNKFIAYNNDEVFEKIYTLGEYHPLMGDEAIRFIWSRDWNRSPNKEIIRLTTQIRTKKLLFFLNIPKLTWMDSSFREAMIDIWVWTWATLNEQGNKECYAFVFQRDENQGIGDSWHLDKLRELQKRKKKSIIGRFTDVDRILKLVKNHPCYFDAFKFPSLPKEMYEAYQKIRDERAFEKSSEYVNQKEVGKIMSYNLKYNWQELLARVAQGKFKVPTSRIISEVVLKNPQDNNLMVNHVSVNNWINEIKSKLPEQRQLITEPEELVGDEYVP